MLICLSLILSVTKVEIVNEDWWNSALFTSFVTSTITVIIALAVVFLDHKKQREAREEEERKQRKTREDEERKRLREMESYFIEMVNALLAAAKEQMESYDDVVKSLESGKHGEHIRKNIPWLNLKKIYYLKPTDAFQIFVLNQPGESEENTKRLISIYNALDSIERTKELDEINSDIINRKIEILTDKFYSEMSKLDSDFRHASTKVYNEQIKSSLPFFQALTKVRTAYRELGKDEKVDEKDIRHSLSINVIKAELLDKIENICNDLTYFEDPFRNQFLDTIFAAKKAYHELIIQEKHYMQLLAIYKDSLEKSGVKLRIATDALNTIRQKKA